MSAYYLNKEPCFFAPREACIFQIASTREPRSFYVRINKQRGGYYQQSLKEPNPSLAMERAREIWIEFKTAQDRGHHYGKTRFLPLFEMFLKKSSFREDRRKRIEHVFERYFSGFWKNYDVRDIGNNEWKSYVKWRCDYWDNIEREGGKVPGNAKRIPGVKTLKSERQLLKQFLRWCVEEERVLHVVPSISPVLDDASKFNNKKTRGYPLDDSQYASIIQRLRHWAITANDEPNWIHRYARMRLFYFILITNNCLLRPGTEATNLRWKDLVLTEGKTGIPIAMWDVKVGKKGARSKPAVSTYRGVLHILRWRKIARSFGFGADEDLVFPNYDGNVVPTHYLNRVLKRLLKKWGFEYGNSGQSITLYTFRATSIARRITKSKWDVSQVAAAANTSIAQISNAYVSEWIKQDPDRWANTSPNPKSHIPVTEEQSKEINDLLDEFDL